MATILVVEDREGERHLLTTVFEHTGHRVVDAENGLDALARMTMIVPDLVVTDIMMPTMDGFEFIRQMRERDETRNTPVILYTAAYDERTTRILAENCTAATILPKPSEPDTLIRAVERILGQPTETRRILGDEFRNAHLELVTTQLHQKMADLEHTNSELLKINRALEESNNALRQFAFAAAHDLQEPLRNIATAAGMLDHLLPEVDPSARIMVKECIENARRMHGMVKDLLAYSTVVEDSEAPKVIVDLNEAAKEVLTNLEMQIAETGGKVETERLPHLALERTHFVQLLQNLVGNAIKYRRPSVPPHIRISAAFEGDGWVFRVEDNGIGFNQEYGERIFKIFKRLHSRKEYPGSGIGLAICARIVAHYEGQIWAVGHPGQGAVFSFTLPAAAKVREAV